MRYRIKIQKFKNGRYEGTPQIKARVGWLYITNKGKVTIWNNYVCATRKTALEYIDLHYDGNHKKHSIEFDYVYK